MDTDFRGNILNDIIIERQYQDKRWGNRTDDEMNEPNDFVSYISSYATKWFPGGFVPYNPVTVDEFRTSMIKTAAIAVAAVESLDRQRDEAGHAFYEAGHRPTLESITEQVPEGLVANDA